MPTLSFFFWNVMRKNLGYVLSDLVNDHPVNVLLIAESLVDDQDILNIINRNLTETYHAISGVDDKVRIFTTLPLNFWEKRQSDPLNARMAIWSIRIPNTPEFLLAVAHFVSKRSEDSDGQLMLAQELSKEIQRVEQSVGHQRTLIVGDLNMNPFDPGVTGAAALHGVMTKHIALKRTRKGCAQELLPRSLYNNLRC